MNKAKTKSKKEKEFTAAYPYWRQGAFSEFKDFYYVEKERKL